MIFNKLSKIGFALIISTQMIGPDFAMAAARCPHGKCHAANGRPARAGGVNNKSVHVNKNVNVNVRPGVPHYRPRPAHYRPVYRPWYHRPHYGMIIAGVTLGTIIVVSANNPPAPPSPNLCWYWSNSSMTGGYWDYCY